MTAPSALPNISGILPVAPKDLFDGTGFCFSAAEIEFIAENTMTSIKPRRKIEEIDLLAGSFGPFRPNRIEKVPLWLAVVLRKGNHCSLVPPPWLSKAFLEKVLEMEHKVPEYQALPEHYLEISMLLLECGAADIPDSEDIRKLVQCLREVRHHKTLQGLMELDGDPLVLASIGRMELNEIRTFVLPAMDRLVTLKRAKEQENLTHPQHSSSHNSHSYSLATKTADNPGLDSLARMLAERKKKTRLAADPNNKAWSDDASSFGRKMLEKMGWRQGDGLGAKRDGATAHLNVAVKDNLLGIGASLKDAENGWLNCAKSYQELLDRLAQQNDTVSSDVALEDAESSKKKRKRTKDKQEKEQRKREKKEEKKREKKEKKRREKKEQKSPTKSVRTAKKQKRGETPVSPVSASTSLPSSNNTIVNPRAHRAKFIRNKSVAGYSEAHLREIFGGVSA